MKEKKMKKINLSNIFKVTIDEQVQPIFTERQKDWIKEGVNLKGLFSNPIKTISRIDDFRRKFLMSYWGKLEENCSLCNQPTNRMHIFKNCSVVEKWENEVYMKRKDKVDIRLVRKESFMNHILNSHTLSWIYNWCIWKNYWQVKYKEFDKSDELESQINNYREIVRFNEFLHLKYSNATVKLDKIEKVAKQTQLFTFYIFGKSFIEEVKEEVKEEKMKRTRCFLYMNRRKRKIEKMKK
jgi:hypothetical protein